MIYLDSAATTLQKPPAVSLAAAQAIRNLASPGRGGHRPAMDAAETAWACRQEAAQLFHAADPARIVFTFNATHGLNIAIKTLARPGSFVAISGYEHNAVTRPLHTIPNLRIHVVRAPLFDPEAMLEGFRSAIAAGAELVICSHVSNVFGAVQPIEAIADLCRQHRVSLIIDASQSAGLLPLDFERLGADFIAMPGHKGLYGPQGTGLLLCGRTVPVPIAEGGTGSESLNQSMPEFLPDRLEAGTHNMPGIAGLREGLRFIRHYGPDFIRSHEQALIRQLGEGLAHIPGVQVFLSPAAGRQSGVLSFRIAGCDCESVGERLSEEGFALRAGLHCAPLAHETAGTLETGTVRASVSVFNTEEEIRALICAVSRL